MEVPLLDLKVQYASLKSEIGQAINSVLESQEFILGANVANLEKEIAGYCQTKHAIGVASGTDALLLALKGFEVGKGDEVITSAYSFFASAGTIWNAGATPVFIDIEPGSFNMNPELVEAAVTKRTKAIMPVHLFGQIAWMDPIMDIARRKGLAVIEDAAQSLGARQKDSAGTERKAGSIGSAGCTSFFPSKNLGGFGDGGMVVTNDDRAAERIRLLRVHGGKEKYLHSIVGTNSRLDAIQAAVLRVKLKSLEEWNRKRKEHAMFYDREFRGTPVSTPVVRNENVCIYNQYVVRVPQRDKVKDLLKKKGIGTAIYYPLPLHLQECFAGLKNKKGDFPEAEKASIESLALPVFPELTPEQRSYVAASLKEIVSEVKSGG
ncbi:MAG: DegT/DnrJ/EryC1/StrS family aminotransferase [Candidatus Eisenbacteria bacterium]|nr:DegT/DnrJ/EryC1/StrS family aminotransferase [Candidatus Eisenbacteria bacterium]